MALGAAMAGALAGCGDDASESGDDRPPIEVRLDDAIPSIIRVTDVTCAYVADTELVASGVVRSSSESVQYVNLQVRFVDGDDVRVELATDSVSDLLVGEAARWSASTYADGAPDVRRCEVTATVG